MATKEEIKLIFERVEELYLLISAELDKFQNECQYSDLEKNHAKYYSKEYVLPANMRKIFRSKAGE